MDDSTPKPNKQVWISGESWDRLHQEVLRRKLRDPQYGKKNWLEEAIAEKFDREQLPPAA